ncbi:MAG: FCD domain-containing protein, partial [Rubrimonas sp.]
TDAARARLEDLHAAMIGLRRAQRLDEYFDVNSAIHDLIIEGAANPVLAESHRRLMLRARRGRYMAIMDSARWDQAVREHEALMGAVRAGAAAAAETIWREHLLNTGRAVAAARRRRPQDGEAGRGAGP